ncbi:related to condensin complex subunit 3 [Serendipita indica DSM 11827]|uniref:Related to condensin complex subunit 3 n=1 Tax=Serendipita indica (strain DSM 11827) TaxID=1109443 RepID=G4T7P0_SERID|nr:related to condensin complex subunit 3 [Serendipita indica DSM 11827]
MPTRVAIDSDDVEEKVSSIFQQVQANVASHKKNMVQLHKLHVQCSQHTQPTAQGLRLVGEKVFNSAFREMICHVLPLKRGTTVADRVVRFVGTYVKYLGEKTTEEMQKDGRGEEEDSLTARFVRFLLSTLLRGFTSKDRYVRYRSVQFVAEIITLLGELEEDLYTSLRGLILERAQDKEVTVRSQAVIAIGKLQKAEQPEDLEVEDLSLVDVLCNIIRYDASPDVRRIALMNTPVAEKTLEAVISRIRDVEDTVRRAVFQHSLPQIPHPRVLTIVQRERILRAGLGDRDPAVKEAARSLTLKWLKHLEGDLIKFLETFDLVGGDVAEQALYAIFEAEDTIFSSVKFEGSYWESLTPEKAFLARVFTDFCVRKGEHARVEDSLPVVTALAFLIQASYNRLADCLRMRQEALNVRSDPFNNNVPEQDASWEAEHLDLEFVVGELFRIAVNMDYGDEIGRRKMFALIREMIGQRALPDGLVPGCLDVLRRLTPSEKDFIRLTVEVIQVMRDPGIDMDQEQVAMDDETQPGDTPMKRSKLFAPSAEKSAEELARMADVDMRCLSLCTAMLERVMSIAETFDENPTLDGVLTELIIPAVKSKEPAMRERGLIALGLCCLIHRKMAVTSFGLFLNQVEKASSSLKIKALQIVFDMLTMYERDLMTKQPGTDGDPQEQITEFLLGVLGNAETESIQAIAGLGLAKLLIAGIITHDKVLQSLVMIYFSPETMGNHQLRQCLSIALPIYAYAASSNQQRLQRVVIPALRILTEVFDELDSEQEMITPLQILGTLVDWTDAQKVFAPDHATSQTIYSEIHVDLAVDMISAMFDADDAQRKVYIQVLNKLYLPNEIDENKLRKLRYLAVSYRMKRGYPDAASKASFERFLKSLEKHYAEVFEGLPEEEARKMEAFKDLFEFLDEIVPDVGGDTAKESRKRLTQAKQSNETTWKERLKRAGSDESDTTNTSPSPPSKRPKSTRAAVLATHKVPKLEYDNHDSNGEESEEEDSEDRRSSTKRKRETIEDIDADIDQLLGKRLKRSSGASATSAMTASTTSRKTGRKYNGGKLGKPRTGATKATSARRQHATSSDESDAQTLPESTLPEGSEIGQESDDESEHEVAGDLLGTDSE